MVEIQKIWFVSMQQFQKPASDGGVNVPTIHDIRLPTGAGDGGPRAFAPTISAARPCRLHDDTSGCQGVDRTLLVSLAWDNKAHVKSL